METVVPIVSLRGDTILTKYSIAYWEF